MSMTIDKLTQLAYETLRAYRSKLAIHKKEMPLWKDVPNNERFRLLEDVHEIIKGRYTPKKNTFDNVFIAVVMAYGEMG